MPDLGRHTPTGHLLGLAVAIPDLPPADRRAVLSGLLADRHTGDTLTLRVPGIGSVDLLYQPGLVRPWGARPQRWRQGSRQWVSATPVVLDRYPKKGREADEVRRSCRTLGLPDPVEVAVSQQPLAPGAVRLRPGDLPEQARGRLFRHVRPVFDRPVSGLAVDRGLVRKRLDYDRAPAAQHDEQLSPASERRRSRRTPDNGLLSGTSTGQPRRCGAWPPGSTRARYPVHRPQA
jgi:hypothetical protein